MGPSGIGKTTLVRIIAGLTTPDSGEIIGITGKQFSIVFQEDRLLGWESAYTNVMLVTTNTNKNLAKQMLTQAGLGDSIHKKAAQLSGGMKRRVCICRALIAAYDVLILDEPFKGLDSGIKPTIMRMVRQYAQGKTVLCITHDREEAAFLGGYLVEL